MRSVVARPLPEVEGFRQERRGRVVPIARARRAYRRGTTVLTIAGVGFAVAVIAWAVWGAPVADACLLAMALAAAVCLIAAGRGRR